MLAAVMGDGQVPQGRVPVLVPGVVEPFDFTATQNSQMASWLMENGPVAAFPRPTPVLPRGHPCSELYYAAADGAKSSPSGGRGSDIAALPGVGKHS